MISPPLQHYGKGLISVTPRIKIETGPPDTESRFRVEQPVSGPDTNVHHLNIISLGPELDVLVVGL